METKHTPEQYQLSLHIAALETVINYVGTDMPTEDALRFITVKLSILKKLNEINLSVTPEDLFNHIASFYQTKH